MNRRAIAAAAATAAMVLLAPSSAAAVTDSFISVHAPKTVKAGKTFNLNAVATFDSRIYNPPYTYLSAGVWQHRGDERCLKAVPVDRPGWRRVIQHDYDPSIDTPDHSITFIQPLKRKAGTYRWCAYVYTVEGDILSGETYHPVARARARTTVSR